MSTSMSNLPNNKFGVDRVDNSIRQLGERLLDAITRRDINEVKKFLAQTAPVNNDDRRRAASLVHYQNKHDQTPLIKASEKGYLEIVEALIEAGADIDYQNYFGQTALIEAIYNNRLNVVLKLIKSGASVDLQFAGATALMTAARKGHLEIVQALIEAGANIEHQNEEGETVLMGASKNGFSEVVQELIKAGAKIDFQDENGWTAAMYATSRGRIKTLLVLIRSGANLNLQNNDGRTAYDLARYDLIRNLILGVKKIRDLRKDQSTYFFTIPKDLVGIIEDQWLQDFELL